MTLNRDIDAHVPSLLSDPPLTTPTGHRDRQRSILRMRSAPPATPDW